jgi:hypothetical protein
MSAFTAKPKVNYHATVAGQQQLQQARITGTRRQGDELYPEQNQRKLQPVYCDKQIGDHVLPYHYCDFRHDLGPTTHTMVIDSNNEEFCIACGQLRSLLATCPGEANAMRIKADALIKFAQELKAKADALAPSPIDETDKEK